MQIKIEKLVYGGEGLARLPADEHGPGKSVFVPFVLEGEQVEATIEEQRPGFSRARLDLVAQASPSRIAAPCPYFQRCGGCHYQHTSYAAQLEIKASVLKETLKRTAKLDLPRDLQIHASQEWNYRNRTRLKVQHTPEFALGYYEFRSHDLLPIEQCPISSPLINRAIAAVWDSAGAEELSTGLREIEFFANHADDSLLIEAYCDHGTSRQNARAIAEGLAKSLPEIRGVTVYEQTQPGRLSDPKRIAGSGESHLKYETRASTYKVSAASFFQINRFLIDDLVELVTANGSGQVAWDLYAGVGLFTVPLARSFAQVIAVESSQTSFADLKENAPQEVKAVSATTEQFLRQALGPRPDFVVADPPRGGLGENVVRALARLGPPRITYVSCDPSTLARDLRTLVSLGYRIDGAHLIDLFPQTFHLESVFHLAR